MPLYYEHAGVTIYHGDCREVLPTLPRVDAVITDPPYGINRDGSEPSTSRHNGRKAYEFLGWDNHRVNPDLLREILRFCPTAIIWGGNYFADVLPPTQRWLVWDKAQRIAQSDGELAWTSMQGALRIYDLNRVALLTDGAQHPTQKPVELMQWCIGFFPSARTILDPFMGAGSTLVAAKQLGRRAIGIEIEEEYCEIAAGRLAQDVFMFE